SHDRYFMDRLVNHLFVFEGDGAIKDYPGNYTQYRIETATEKTKVASEKDNIKKEKDINNTPKNSVNKSQELKKLTYNEQRELEQLGSQITQLEEEKRNLEQAMGNSNLDFEILEAHANRIAEILAALATKEMRWLALSERAE